MCAGCWGCSVLGPTFIAKGKRRRLQLGLREDTAATGLHYLRDNLSSEPMTRGEMVNALAKCRLALERRSQAPIHLIGLAALSGIALLGDDRPNVESTYVLMDTWVDSADEMPKDEALAQLAWRYLLGYATTDAKDFAG